MSSYKKRLTSPPKYRSARRFTVSNNVQSAPVDKEAMQKVIEDFVDWKDNDKSESGERDRVGQGIERYFKWTPGDSKNPRRNVSSVENHYRKLRINEIRKMDPDGFKRLQKDIQRTVQGGYVSNLKTTVKRSMGATILRNCILRFLDQRMAKAWFRWTSVTHGTTTVKDFCKMKSTLEGVRGQLGHTLSELKAITEERNALMADIRNARTGEHLSQEKLAALEAQLTSTAQRTMFLFVKRMYFARSIGGWNKWKRFVQWQKSRAAAASRSLRHWHHLALSKMFRTWNHNVRDIKKQRAQLERTQRAAKKWQHSKLLVPAWNSWKARWEDAVRRRGNMKRAMARWRNSVLSKAFQRYKSIVKTTLQNRVRISRSVAKIQNRALASALNGWRSKIEELKRNRTAIARSLGRMRNRKLAGAFIGWSENVKEKKSLRGKLDRAARMWKFKSVGASVNTWKWFVYRRSFLRGMLLRLLSRWKNKELGKGFHGLRANVAICKQEDERKRLQEEEAARQKRLMNNIVLRMKNRQLAIAFHTYKATVEERKKNRALLKRAGMRMKNRQAAAALSSWVAFLHRRRFARNFLGKMVGRWANKEIGKGFQGWLAYLKRLDSHEAELQRQADEEERKEKVMNNIVRRMKNRKLAIAFETYKTTVAEIKKNRILVKRAAAKMRNRQVASALAGWQELINRRRFARNFLNKLLGRWKNREISRGFGGWKAYLHRLDLHEEELQRQADEEARKKELMENIVRRIKYRAAALAFYTYKSRVEERKRNRFLLKRCAQKMRMRQAAAALAGWQDLVSRRRFARSFLNKLLGRWKNREIGRGFGGWKAFLHRLDLHEEELRRQAEEESRKEKLINNIVRRMKNRALSSAFEACKYFVQERKRMRALLHRAAMKIKNRQASAAVASWQDLVSRRRFARSFLNKLLGKWKHSEIGRGFVGWKAYLHRLDLHEEALQRQAEEEARKERLMNNIVRRMKNRALSSAFEACKHFVEERKRIRILLHRAAMKMKHRQAAAAFASWDDFKQKRQRARQFLKLAVARWSTKSLAKGMNGWKAYLVWCRLVDERAQAGRLAEEKLRAILKQQEDQKAKMLANTLLRIKYRRKAMAFASIVDFWEEAKREKQEQARREALMRSIIFRIQQRSLSTACAAWVSFVEERKRNRTLLKRAAAKMRLRQAAAAFAGWIDLTERRVFARKFLNKLLGRWKNQEIARGFAGWKAYLHRLDLHEQEVERQKEEAARKERLMNNIVRRMKNRKLAVAFEAYTHFTEEKKRMRVLLHRAAMKIKNRQVAAAISSWQDLVDRRAFARNFLGRMLSRWKNSELSAGFTSWKLHTVQHRMAEALQSSGAMKREQMLMKITKRILNRQVSGAFDAWTLFVDTRKRNRYLVSRAARKMKFRAASRSFESWIDFVDWRAHARKTLRKILGKLKNQTIARGFRSWQKAVDALRMAHSADQTAALRAQEAALERMRQQTAKRIIARMRFREVSICWGAWVALVGMQKNERLREAQAKLEKEMEEAKNRKMRAIILRVKYRDKSRAFDAWLHVVAEKKRLRVILNRTARKWKNRTTARSFISWVDFFEERKRVKALLSRIIARMCKTDLAAGLGTWKRSHIEAKLHEQMERARSAQSAELNALRQREYERQMALAESENSKRERLLRHVTARIMNRKLGITFYAWDDCIKNEKRNKRMIRKSLARITKKSLVKCFNALSENLRQKLYYRHLANQMFARRTRTWGDSAKRTCIREWAAAAKKNRRARDAWAARCLRKGLARSESSQNPSANLVNSARRGPWAIAEMLQLGGASKQQVDSFKSVVVRFIGAIGMNKKSFTLSGPSAANASATVLSFETQREGAAFWLDVNRSGLSTITGLALWACYQKILSELHALNVGEVSKAWEISTRTNLSKFHGDLKEEEMMRISRQLRRSRTAGTALKSPSLVLSSTGDAAALAIEDAPLYGYRTKTVQVAMRKHHSQPALEISRSEEQARGSGFSAASSLHRGHNGAMPAILRPRPLSRDSAALLGVHSELSGQILELEKVVQRQSRKERKLAASLRRAIARKQDHEV